MNASNESQSDAPQRRAAGVDNERDGKKTPSTDVQADDAGTPESGNGAGARGTATDAAMKQTSKTDSESGAQR